MSKQKTVMGVGVLLAVIFLFFNLGAGDAQNRADDILSRITEKIHEHNARWQAGETAVSRLSQSERRRMLGAQPPLAIRPDKQLNYYPIKATPSFVDWRNYGGENYVTAVRDQASCGSCWAFAIVAVMEAMFNIEGGGAAPMGGPIANFGLDLSEQFLVSCSGAGDCANGGYSEDAAEFVRKYGIARESYFPYTAQDVPCEPTGTWVDEAFTIEDWGYVTQAVEDREAIYTSLQDGPIALYLVVYSDLYYYTSGVYEHVYGPLEGGHMVLLVGYDKAGGYWICKNSWGTDWGESGYFKIKMGECNTGTWTVAAWGVGTPDFHPPINITATLEENRSFLKSEDINVVRWESNPANSGMNVVKYRVYRVTNQYWEMKSEVDASVNYYWHRGVDKYKNYTYAVTAVTDAGAESIAGYATVN